MSSSSHVSLTAIYLSKQHQPMSVHSTRATSGSSRTAKLQSNTHATTSTMPVPSHSHPQQPVMPYMTTQYSQSRLGTGAPGSSPSSRGSSRPTSARIGLSGGYTSATGSSASLVQQQQQHQQQQLYQLPSFVPGGQVHHEKNKFGNLLDDMEHIFHAAMAGQQVHSPRTMNTLNSQSAALLNDSPSGVTGVGKLRPSSASVRGRSAERRPIGPPDPGAYMSRKGKTALQKLNAAGERDLTMGYAGYQLQKQREEQKEQAAMAPPVPQATPYTAPTYFQSYSVSQLHKALASALETIALHETSAKQQQEFYNSRIADLEKEVKQWKRMCDMYRSGLDTTELQAAAVVASAMSAVNSTPAQFSSSSPSKVAPKVAVPTKNDADDEYEDDTSTAPAKSTVESEPASDDYADDFDGDAKAKSVNNVKAPATVAPPKQQVTTPLAKSSKEDEIDFEDEIEEEDSTMSKKVAPATTAPTAVQSAASDDYAEDSGFEEQHVEPIKPKPAPATGSLKGPKAHKHVKKSSVTFADADELQAKTKEASAEVMTKEVESSGTHSKDSPRANSPKKRSSSPLPDYHTKDEGAALHHTTAATSPTSPITSSHHEKKSPSADKLARLEAEKARRAAEIDSMFPSDDDDAEIIAKHNKSTPTTAPAAVTSPGRSKTKATLDAPPEVDATTSSPTRHKKKKKHHHSNENGEQSEDENTSLPASPKPDSPSRKKKKHHASEDAADSSITGDHVPISSHETMTSLSSAPSLTSPKHQSEHHHHSKTHEPDQPHTKSPRTDQHHHAPPALTSLSAAPPLSPRGAAVPASPSAHSKAQTPAVVDEWKAAPAHTLLEQDKHGRSPDDISEQHHHHHSRSGGSSSTISTSGVSLHRPASPSARSATIPPLAPLVQQSPRLTPASSGRGALAPLKESSTQQQQSAAQQSSMSSAPPTKMVRPSSATRDGVRSSGGSRPSSASSRENSRPSSASRTRPNMPSMMPTVSSIGLRPMGSATSSGGMGSLSNTSSTPLSPIKSTSSYSSSGPLTIPSLNGDKNQPFILVRDDEDEDGDSDLYEEDDIPEEESFHVQHQQEKEIEL